MAKKTIERPKYDDAAVSVLSGRSRALRLYWGLTQTELAERAGLPRAAIALLETNRSRGRSKRLREGLARAYGVGVETLAAYNSGQLKELDVVQVSSRAPARPGQVDAAPAGYTGSQAGPAAPQVGTAVARRGRPPGTLKPGAWNDRGFAGLCVSDSAPAQPRRLSYACPDLGQEWERFPNLARAVDLVVEDTGAGLGAVEQSALALALANEERSDRSVLAWAVLLERHVMRMRSGCRFSPHGLPDLLKAIRQASAKAPAELVERAATEAARAENDPRSLDSAAWFERIEAQLSAARCSPGAPASVRASASGSAKPSGSAGRDHQGAPVNKASKQKISGKR